MESPAYHPHSYVARQISRNGFWHCRTNSIRSSALLLPGPSLRHPREQSSVPRVWQTFERESEKGWRWPRLLKPQSNLAKGPSGRCLRQRRQGYRLWQRPGGGRRGQRARTLFELYLSTAKLAAKNIRNGGW